MPSHDLPPSGQRPRGAGGPFILILLTGIVVGFLLGQATMGFLVGAAAGIAFALILWMRDRSR